ncbi:GGDEF domain-containing protein [Streptomyces sp. NBC_01224]|uniref:GGDEF domain-containing protein n=1 Tax=Streptomyces sp. NBC_01224 TaxID=2903783 RepID=UPI003FA350FC
MPKGRCGGGGLVPSAARRCSWTCANPALVMVDADHFKAVNDTMGHPAGDAVLAAFGTRLTAWAGPHASVGRLGGDEPLTELTRSFSQVRRHFC